jgi:hypothetical protein
MKRLLAEHLVSVVDAFKLSQLLVEGDHFLKLFITLDREVLRLGVDEQLLQPAACLFTLIKQEQAVVLEIILQHGNIVQRGLLPRPAQQFLLLLQLMLCLGGDGRSQAFGLCWGGAQWSSWRVPPAIWTTGRSRAADRLTEQLFRLRET